MAVQIKQNFKIWTGNDLNVNFNVTDDNGDALNLTAVALRWRAAVDPYSSAVISKYSTVGTSSIEITNTTAGQLTVKLNEGDTNGLQAGVYYHELEVEDSTGNPFTVSIGYLTLEKSLI